MTLTERLPHSIVASMEDRLPHESAPGQPEIISFLPDDSALAVAAVSHYVSSSLKTLEANWVMEGYRGLSASVESALEELDTLSAFVEGGRGLAKKLAQHNKNPQQPVTLSDPDIEMLGFSLFRFGNQGYTHALQAVVERWVRPDQNTYRELDDKRARSKRIFDQLTPLAIERGLMWMDWQSAR